MRGVLEAIPEADVAVVDDASVDGTRAEALSAGAAVLSHGVNLGYGAALETGYLYAAEKGYSILLQMDGDGQHLPGELPAILADVRSGDADIVLGSRYLAASAHYHTSFARRTGQKVFAGMLRILSGTSVSDPTSGFQCLSRRAIGLYTSGIFPYDYPDADILLLAHYAGLRIKEVPVKMVERSEGTSMHSGWKPFYYVAKMCLSMFVVMLGRRGWKNYVP